MDAVLQLRLQRLCSHSAASTRPKQLPAPRPPHARAWCCYAALPCPGGYLSLRTPAAYRQPRAQPRVTARSAPAVPLGTSPNGQRLPSRAPPPAPTDSDVLLPRSLLINKLVVTRTTGRSLGYIGQLYVDMSRLEVVSMDMKPSALATSVEGNILLSSLRQIGDVVLVHDEAVLDGPVADERYGLARMVGAVVETEDGVRLGKVRDFWFNPDDGAVSRLKYDGYGVPAIPEPLVSSWSVGIEWVVAAYGSKIILAAGAEAAALQESTGALDSAVASVYRFWTEAPTSSDADYMEQWATEYQAWREQYGDAYASYYGRAPPPPVAYPPQQQQPPQQQAAYVPPPQRQLPEPRARSYGDALGTSQRAQQAPAQMGGQRRYADAFDGAGRPLSYADARVAEPAGRRRGTGPPQDPRYRGANADAAPLPPPRYAGSGRAPPQQRSKYPAPLPPPPAQRPSDPAPPASGGTTVARVQAFAPPKQARSPYQQRDADGNYGDAPLRDAGNASMSGRGPPQAATRAVPTGVRFDEWAVAEASGLPDAAPVGASERGAVGNGGGDVGGAVRHVLPVRRRPAPAREEAWRDVGRGTRPRGDSGGSAPAEEDWWGNS